MGTVVLRLIMMASLTAFEEPTLGGVVGKTQIYNRGDSPIEVRRKEKGTKHRLERHTEDKHEDRRGKVQVRVSWKE